MHPRAYVRGVLWYGVKSFLRRREGESNDEKSGSAALGYCPDPRKRHCLWQAKRARKTKGEDPFCQACSAPDGSRPASGWSGLPEL